MNGRLAFAAILIGLTSPAATGQILIHSATWDQASGGNGHRYDVYLVSSGVGWIQARDAAVAAGGYLATNTSSAENAFVFGLVNDTQLWVNSSNNRSIGPWIGGFQPPRSVEPAGGWQWVTGESWAYTSWAASEPNNSCGGEGYTCFWNQSASSQPIPASTWNDYGNACAGPVIGYVVESDFATFCFGDGSGAACPCSNSGITGHGCANSAGQSALLSAAGTSVPDGMRLIATGETPTGLTLFVQGDSVLPPASYGDGLRCVGGNLKYLYAKLANGGAATAPQGSDLSITARSAQLNDPIAPGSTRYYMTYYRDPNPSFCPSPTGSTFNTSNAVSIQW